MRGRTLILVALLGLALTGNAGAANPAFVPFQTPTRNIACGYSSDPDFLRCDIHSGLRPSPTRPKDCQLDFGGSVGMKPTSRAHRLCVGDTVADPHALVLAYGRIWKRAGFTCLSKAVGLRCTNTSGHGFFLSRERSSLF